MKVSAFTLIELLIVVAIIGVLAAIAVPNFLNAQIRATVARSIADIKAQANALEMYRIDNNHPPFRPPGWPCGNCDVEDLNSSYNLYPITSPIAYMSNLPYDPFIDFPSSISMDANRGDGLEVGVYLYVGVRPENAENNPHRSWRVWGWGPDKTRQSIPVRPYAASNGLRSHGDIIASEGQGFLTEDISHLFGIALTADIETHQIGN
ncbi:prepilin-type N-terminal cleavage/methylation domain-containing protein [bacterium]|nr:prepilin-type N-terminal cleavage/methylation domain-containing protein [bacterium]